MPDLGSLEVFVAIAQTGSLGGAARELGLTQQAVSRRLAVLEARTGVTLAIRTTRGSQITPAGTSLAEWAAQLLEVAHDIDTALGSLRIEGTQRLTVVASPTIVEYLMPHWLLSLRSAASRRNETAPRIDLAAANSAQATALVRYGAVDLGFVETPQPPEGLRHCVVSTDELVVVVSPNHEWARLSRAVSALELAQTSLVCREPRAGIRDSLAVALRGALGVEVQQAPPILELPSAGAVRAAVLAGAGPAALSRLAVSRRSGSRPTTGNRGFRRSICAAIFGLSGSAEAPNLPARSKALLTHIRCCTEERNRDASRRRSSSGSQTGS